MRWRDASRLDWQMIALWGPVVAVAALNQAGVGLENAWTGSSLALSLTSVLLAGPLLLRVERPSWAATLAPCSKRTVPSPSAATHPAASKAISVT